MNNYEVLHSPFNVKTHKETFTNYLEVVILADGTVEYAVPSHVKKLEKLVCEKYKFKWDNDTFGSIQLQAYYMQLNLCLGNWLEWLIEESGAVCVWNSYYIGVLNDAQRNTLIMLTEEGVYYGKI